LDKPKIYDSVVKKMLKFKFILPVETIPGMWGGGKKGEW
jgi:hypothetical protein